MTSIRVRLLLSLVALAAGAGACVVATLLARTVLS